MNNDIPNAAQDTLQRVLALISTVFGLFLIGFGIWALAGAVYVTWELFKDPDSISYFAIYFIETARVTARLSHDGESLAHLLSWFTVVLLLLLLGKLGDWCITSGAQLFMFGKTRSRSRD
jgi:tellurite resistance protein TehA-like permease